MPRILSPTFRYNRSKAQSSAGHALAEADLPTGLRLCTADVDKISGPGALFSTMAMGFWRLSDRTSSVAVELPIQASGSADGRKVCSSSRVGGRAGRGRRPQIDRISIARRASQRPRRRPSPSVRHHQLEVSIVESLQWRMQRCPESKDFHAVAGSWSRARVRPDSILRHAGPRRRACRPARRQALARKANQAQRIRRGAETDLRVARPAPNR